MKVSNILIKGRMVPLTLGNQLTCCLWSTSLLLQEICMLGGQMPSKRGCIFFNWVIFVTKSYFPHVLTVGPWSLKAPVSFPSVASLGRIMLHSRLLTNHAKCFSRADVWVSPVYLSNSCLPPRIFFKKKTIKNKEAFFSSRASNYQNENKQNKLWKLA